MLNHLSVRLLSAFVLVIAIATGATALLTRQGAATQFAHFMVADAMVRPARLVDALTGYYAQHASWQGLETALPGLVEAAADGVMHGMMGGMMGMHNNRLRVVDAAGQVVADSAAWDAHAAGLQDQPAHAAAVQAALARWPLVVDGVQVGEVWVDGGLMGSHALDDGRLLESVTRAAGVAGMAAGVVALGLAVLLVREITRPLSALTHASSRIAAGDLTVRVPVQSRDELGDLAATFNRMADSLDTQERLRRDLVADIAHELRTPLAGIQGTVEAMQDGVFPLTEANLATIHAETLLLNRLVEDLRLLAHAEAGQLALDRAQMDLGDLCRRMAAARAAQAHARGIRLAVEVAPALPPLWGDEQRLGPVMANLVENALRHAPDGSAVEVAVAAVEGGVQATVTDAGPGVPPELAARIFERFFRADRSRARTTGGSGLGLAIARHLVQAHGGRIWVESPPAGRDTGSRFGVWLPIH